MAPVSLDSCRWGLAFLSHGKALNGSHLGLGVCSTRPCRRVASCPGPVGLSCRRDQVSLFKGMWREGVAGRWPWLSPRVTSRGVV